MAYADSTLQGEGTTWFNPLQPDDGRRMPAHSRGASINNGRTARIYGAVTTAPTEHGVSIDAGGTVGPGPAPGPVFRLIGADGAVVLEVCGLPIPRSRRRPFVGQVHATARLIAVAVR